MTAFLRLGSSLPNLLHSVAHSCTVRQAHAILGEEGSGGGLAVVVERRNTDKRKRKTKTESAFDKQTNLVKKKSLDLNDTHMHENDMTGTNEMPL